jgi:hypothetical protein
MPHSRSQLGSSAGTRLAYRRHDLAALRRNPGDARCLSCARCDLVALAPTEEARPMTNGAMPMPVAVAESSRRRQPARRSQGAAVPHDWPGHWPAHPHGAAASERLCDDRPARSHRRHRNQARQPQLPGSRVTAYLKTARRWKRWRRWRTTPQRARPSSTIAGATSSASMRSSGS